MRLLSRFAAASFAIALLSSSATNAHKADVNDLWMKIEAKDKYARTEIFNTGVTIEGISEGYVYAFGSKDLLKEVSKVANVETSFELTKDHVGILDFPTKDQKYHNYKELMDALDELEKDGGDLVTKTVIGESHGKRDIVSVVITAPSKQVAPSKLDEEIKPAVVFMGGHHAREHLSVEIPLKLAQYLVEKYNDGDQEVVDLLENREVHIIPLVNPDGKEHDINAPRSPLDFLNPNAGYRLWRKNMRNNGDGTKGVDLNRNYGFKWGTGGSSKNTNNDTYMGPKPFSEPETQAIRDYVVANDNISILLTFHSYSELILYPWGHKYDSIGNNKDLRTHEALAKKMATWNGYKPQQSSDLYIASGDTTDWSYGELGIISFTFELDPKNAMGGTGFYPGEKAIDVAFNKNLKPSLYLIEMSDNPYKVLQPASQRLGLTSLAF